MRNSVLLTLFDRDEITLLNTLRALTKNTLEDTEILLADDGSSIDYSALEETFSPMPLRWLRHSTLEHRPETYNIEGHNNPAHVNNWLLDQVDSERVLFLSSDVILPPHALGRAFSWDPSAIWSAYTVDMDSGVMFCGSSRPYPMMWAVAMETKVARSVRFDERYCDGMAFEDNDFMGRAALEVGRIVLDGGVLDFHQSHENVAYSDDLVGFKRSERYTIEKWGGIPFHSAVGQSNDPLELDMSEHPAGGCPSVVIKVKRSNLCRVAA